MQNCLLSVCRISLNEVRILFKYLYGVFGIVYVTIIVYMYTGSALFILVLMLNALSGNKKKQLLNIFTLFILYLFLVSIRKIDQIAKRIFFYFRFIRVLRKRSF